MEGEKERKRRRRKGGGGGTERETPGQIIFYLAFRFLAGGG